MMDGKRRTSGILLPIFSLPSRYGIGTFGRVAFAFVDWLAAAGQSDWQILPLCPTSFGDSPYQSFSTFAGNPYFIDLELLINEKLLTRRQCDAVNWGDSPEYVDYEKQYQQRYRLLRKAFTRSAHRETPAYAAFEEQNREWLDNYCLFMALKQHFDQRPWLDWDEDIKRRNPAAIAQYQHELREDIEFHRFLQYTFFKQWFALKAFANQQGIRIIGDLPIYVAMDSADAWANPELFRFDERLNPTHVAGVPPDYFSEDGQLWGNPLYNWPVHKATRYDWWIRRIAYTATMYDTVRIDHFRGFAEYWAIPYAAATAKKGKWRKGSGMDLFRELKNRIGKVDIIAEDLGVQSPGLHALLSKTGFPGMKVLQFAFHNAQDSDYLPHHYSTNCVVYTGTHDNTTTRHWYEELTPDTRAFVNRYCRIADHPDLAPPVQDIIATAFQSVAGRVIIPLQDFLALGEEARVNTPSTLGDNWKWRVTNAQLTASLHEQIASLTRTYFRDRSVDVENQ